MIAEKEGKYSTSSILVLDNIRSVHNTGSLFRTAETLGIKTIYCIGTTPTPLDRFGNKRSDFSKVSLGAEEMVSWEHLADEGAVRRLGELKKKGMTVIALEQNERSIDYKKVPLAGAAAFIVGNEVAGVSADLLASADIIAEIPLAGKKESLNVSVAAGIFLYRLLDR